MEKKKIVFALRVYRNEEPPIYSHFSIDRFQRVKHKANTLWSTRPCAMQTSAIIYTYICDYIKRFNWFCGRSEIGRTKIIVNRHGVKINNNINLGERAAPVYSSTI